MHHNSDVTGGGSGSGLFKGGRVGAEGPNKLEENEGRREGGEIEERIGWPGTTILTMIRSTARERRVVEIG